MNRRPSCLLSVCFSTLLLLPSLAARADVYTFEAREQSARTFFSELSGSLGRPVIVSKAAAAKRIGGTFDLRTPQRTFERVSVQMGLIWYSDGQAIYLYDASEIKSSMLSLQTLTVARLQAFLERSGLHDARYPLRSDGLRTFHVSGPPMYVDLVVQAAGLMDNQRSELLLGKQQIGVIHVRNTFVNDRRYELRDDKVTIPGLATVIEQLLRGEQRGVEPSVVKAQTQAPAQRPRGAMPVFPLEGLASPPSDQDPTAPQILSREVAAGNIRVVAYPDTNSLLVKGLPEQVHFIENLVSALDTPKRHVELSLWIIDLHKDELNQLGIDWQGALKSGNTFSASLNAGSATTLDGVSFVTRVLALERSQRANVVSRPVILTQENVPAIFDNNRTFYAPLVGERSVDLQHVTYGTLVSVLPRFAQADEIEMSLNIEDGNEVENAGQGALPTVGRTRISTVARVPHGKSLLVGGFTRDDHGEQIGRVPVLGSIPWIGRLFSYRQSRSANTVRVFLIQPKEILDALEPDALGADMPLLTPQQHERVRRMYFRMSER
ncbi:type III secretion system outer membrane ring subunit SctC [Pseudomonas citri]|uniref:type III secretion system outer membrane ring subunit SctC n=1 Tax=Pseudomonas citri TaxID=2978349 RepID=UPI0021B69829|nr:type III secretion system outer membrane ring subunit SctC [Pseudomonas citri]